MTSSQPLERSTWLPWGDDDLKPLPSNSNSGGLWWLLSTQDFVERSERLGRKARVCASRDAGLRLLRAEGALPCPRGAEAVNAEAIVRLGGAERGKGAGI